VILRKALVTGGAGFIGTRLVEALLDQGVKTVVMDNFSSASGAEIITKYADAGRLTLVKGDCTNATDFGDSLAGVDSIFHLAANPEVRLESNNEENCFQQNILATFNLLNAFKKSGAKIFVFASSSTVYGEPALIPTPENHGPLTPISVYGASKLASEALISSYCNNLGRRAVIFRLANIVGETSKHGVVPDFMKKLRLNPSLLQVLGDGSQTKSYLHVDECVEGILRGTSNSEEQISIFNLGARDFVPVSRIAEIVATEMKLPQAKIVFEGGVDDGRGWVGDVKTMLLDIGRLTGLGWWPKLGSEQSIALTVRRSLQLESQLPAKLA